MKRLPAWTRPQTITSPRRPHLASFHAARTGLRTGFRTDFDRIGGMERNERAGDDERFRQQRRTNRTRPRRRLASELRPSERDVVLTVRLFENEMDALSQLAPAKKGQYARPIILATPEAAFPVWPPANGATRNVNLRINLSSAEEAQLTALSEQAGVDIERYVRWRLLGVLD